MSPENKLVLYVIDYYGVVSQSRVQKIAYITNILHPVQVRDWMFSKAGMYSKRVGRILHWLVSQELIECVHCNSTTTYKITESGKSTVKKLDMTSFHTKPIESLLQELKELSIRDLQVLSIICYYKEEYNINFHYEVRELLKTFDKTDQYSDNKLLSDSVYNLIAKYFDKNEIDSLLDKAKMSDRVVLDIIHNSPHFKKIPSKQLEETLRSEIKHQFRQGDTEKELETIEKSMIQVIIDEKWCRNRDIFIRDDYDKLSVTDSDL